MSIGQELLNVPMGDMIREMAFAIAEAQVKLDSSSIEVAQMMGGLTPVYDEQGKLAFDDSRVFFGHEYMTPAAAAAYYRADAALSGLPKAEADALADRLIEAAGEPAEGQTEIRVPVRVSMLELGFAPTFYQFVDTIIEVKIAIKITRSFESTTKRKESTTRETKTSRSRGGGLAGLFGGKVRKSTENVVSTSQVDASYSAKYSYSAEGASLLRTKLTPIPPPAILEERIRSIMEMENQRRAAAQAALEQTT